MPYSLQETPEAVIQSPAGEANAAVIWLHGLGADGYDFAPIPGELRLPAPLAVRFVFPHARPRTVTINNGMVMRAWYDIAGFGPEAAEDEQGIRESEGVVRRLIAKEVSSGIPPERLVIAGFSQGGAIALQTGLRYPQRLGGIVALSTYLPLSHIVPQEASPASRDTPILMCHGLRDPLVPAALGSASRDALQALGYRVQWESYPMEHQVCMEEIADISRWLQQVLQPPGGVTT